MNRKRAAVVVFVAFGVLMAILGITRASGNIVALAAVIGGGFVAVVAILTRDRTR